MKALTLDELRNDIKSKKGLSLDDLRADIDSTGKSIKKESKGLRGIGKDIVDSAKEIPSALWESAKNIPIEIMGAGNQLATDPKRALKNIAAGFPEAGQGLLNSPRNIAEYLARKNIISTEHAKSVPRSDFNYRDLMGIEGDEEGDALFRSVGNPLTYTGELGQLSKLGRAGARATSGAAQGITTNQNPVLAGITQSALGGATDYATKLYGNLKKEAGRHIINKVLDKADKSKFRKSNQEIEENIASQYTTPEGERMRGDFGTLVGNETAKDAYRISSKIYGSSGREQKKVFDQQLRKLDLHKSELEYKEKMAGLSPEEKKQKLDIEEAHSHLKKAVEVSESKEYMDAQNALKEAKAHEKAELESENKKLEEHTIELKKAPEQVNQLMSETEHQKLLEDAPREVIAANKNTSEKLYKDFNNVSHINLEGFRTPEGSPAYHKAMKEGKKEMASLENMLGDSSDIGREASSAINKASVFFKGKKAQKNVTNGSIVVDIHGMPLNKPEAPIKKATSADIKSHIENLQNHAADLKYRGYRTQGKTVSKIAYALKDDLKNFLEQGGNKSRKALESFLAGNKFHEENVIPWYTGTETKKLMNNPKYKPNIKALSSEIHNPNLEAIHKALPKEVHKSAAYELLTNNAQKIGKEGTTLSPEKIATNYSTQLPKAVKESIAANAPEAHEYLSGLQGTLEKISNQKELIKSLEKKHKSKIEELTKGREAVEGVNAVKGMDQYNAEIDSYTKKHKDLMNKAEKNKQIVADKKTAYQKSVLDALKEAKKRYHGTPEVSTSLSSPSEVKHTAYTAAAMFGAGALGNLISSHAMPAILAFSAFAKGTKSFNKMMTDPAMVKHFLESTRFKREAYKPPEQGYAKKFAGALTLLGTKQPMELELTGGHRQ